MHDIEILGRNLTWTEEGLEYEGSDKHRRALLEGLGVEWRVDAGQQCSRVKKRTRICWTRQKRRDLEVCLAATLNCMSSDRSDVQYAECNSKQLEEAEEGRQVFERSGESDMGDGIMET